jgi:peroxiredoxin
MIEQNQLAPAFSAPNQHNEPISLADYHGKQHVILYFYPKDDTPGCTLEAQQFTQLAAAFAQLDTVIIGVSKDDCASHAAFCEKYTLNVQLLADTTGELCEAYNVWREREKNGVVSMAILRSTFIIDKQSIVRAADYGVIPDGHAQAVLDQIAALG